MIVILDTTRGRAHNFGTRTDAAEFIGVSRPTLRGWLKNPFYLHKSLIITHTSNEKVQQSKRALLKKKMAQFRKEEINHREKREDQVAEVQEKISEIHGKMADFGGVFNKEGDVPINGTRSGKPAIVERSE